MKWYGRPFASRTSAEPGLDALAGGVDRRQGVGVAEDLERLDGGGGGDAVAGVRAAMADLVGQDAT